MIDLSKPSPKNWDYLKHKLPPKFTNLCLYCKEFQYLVEHIESLSSLSHISEHDVAELIVLINRIKEEWFNLLKEKLKEERDIQELKEDMHSALGILYDKNGKLQHLVISQLLQTGKFVGFFVSLKSFIYSKIYNVLIREMSKFQDTFHATIVESARRQFGSMPYFMEKKSTVKFEDDIGKED